jgi:hypothetical protein
MMQVLRLKTYMWPLIAYLTQKDRPQLVAHALSAITSKLELPSQKNSGRTATRRILVLNIDKAGVREDIEQIFEGAHGYELVTWPGYALRAIAGVLLAPGLSHDCYVSGDPIVEKSKLRYRTFLLAVWRHLTARYGIDAVIGVNFGYCVQREFAAALQENGTPFVIVQKENLNGITPRRADFWRTVYEKGRGKFGGRKILVYNQTERDLQISSGVVEPAQVIVTGMPRLDRIHQWRRAHAGKEAERPQVLFFGFSRKDKVPGRNIRELKTKGFANAAATVAEAGDQWAELSWNELCAGTCQGIVAFARRHPDVRVVVKTKKQTTQADEMMELLRGEGDDLPANMAIVRGGDPFELLTQSKVVVGFNTTGLIEALAAGKPVIVPWFGEVHNETLRDIILDVGDAADYAHTPAELTEMIAACLAAEGAPSSLSENSKKILERLVGNSDGAASTRALQAIEAELPLPQVL